MPQRSLAGYLGTIEPRSRHYQHIASCAIGAGQGTFVIIGRVVQLDCLERNPEG